MLPINQVILGGADPLLNTGSLTDQIQYLEEQKRLIEARQRQIQQAANGQQTLQQVNSQQTAKVSVWDLIDAEAEPLTNEQRAMLANNEVMVEVSVVKQKLQDYIVNQIDILGESNPAIKLVKPLAKRAIINNIDSFDKFINAIAKDGKIDIEGIVDEEIEIIKSIPNFDFNIPVLGNGNISNGNITLSIPFINKGIMFNQSDLETFRQLLTK